MYLNLLAAVRPTEAWSLAHVVVAFALIALVIVMLGWIPVRRRR